MSAQVCKKILTACSFFWHTDINCICHGLEMKKKNSLNEETDPDTEHSNNVNVDLGTFQALMLRLLSNKWK